MIIGDFHLFFFFFFFCSGKNSADFHAKANNYKSRPNCQTVIFLFTWPDEAYLDVLDLIDIYHIQLKCLFKESSAQ